MHVSAAKAAAGVLALAVIAGCTNPLGRKYEYEEQLYLSVDGSARVVIDASLPALVALRQVPFDPSMSSAVDRDVVRRFFETTGCGDVRVGQPWVRQGRRFVQVRVAASKLSDLASCSLLSWSTYSFERDDEEIRYVQEVGPPSGGNPGTVNWNGSELVGFKLHAPSPVRFHNVKRLEDGEDGKPDRGNILTWEQRLSDRRAGQPVRLEVRMGAESILFRTLWLFGGAFLGATLLLITLIWLTMRRARYRKSPVEPCTRS